MARLSTFATIHVWTALAPYCDRGTCTRCRNHRGSPKPPGKCTPVRTRGFQGPSVGEITPESSTAQESLGRGTGPEERQLFSNRTRAGLAAAKARGVKLGNPNLRRIGAKYAALGGAASADLARWRANDLRPLYEAAKAAGAQTYQQIADYLNKTGVTTLLRQAVASGERAEA
jgi:hypothetical protein